MNNSYSPPILEALITSRDATRAAEKPDDHKQLTNQFGLKSPPTQLAESHTWSINGSHLFERKQKVSASHTTLITFQGAQNYHHPNHRLGFRPCSKSKEITHCWKHVSPLTPITTVSSSHLEKLRAVFWGNGKEERVSPVWGKVTEYFWMQKYGRGGESEQKYSPSGSHIP